MDDCSVTRVLVLTPQQKILPALTESAMLSAEHNALEDANVLKYLNIRKQEIDHFLARFEAVISSSTLVAGFTVAGVYEYDGDSMNRFTEMEAKIFFAAAFGTVIGSVIATMISFSMIILGPSLTLRGPDGSVEKAYWLLRRESNRVIKCQIFSVVCFSVFFGMCFYGRDRTKGLDTFIFAVLSVLSIAAVLLYVRKLQGEFDFTESDELSPNRAIVRNQKRIISFTKNRSVAKRQNTNRQAHKNSWSETGMTFSSSDIVGSTSGYLEKQGKQSHAVFGSTGSWRKRFFSLNGPRLYQFENEAAYERAKSMLEHEDSNRFSLLDIETFKSIPLLGYEVMVGGRDLTFTLTPSPGSNAGARPRKFRAPTPQKHREWVAAFVKHSSLKSSSSRNLVE